MASNRKARRRDRTLTRKPEHSKSLCNTAPTEPGKVAPIRWRAALLGTTAAGALALAMPSAVRAQVVLNPPGTIPAQCQVTGGAAVCTGNLTAGLDADGPPLSDLTIQNLTAAIAPAVNVTGVDFETTATTGDVTITVDTGAFGITASGTAADGINVDADVLGTLTVRSTGHITSGDYGILVDNNVNGGRIVVISTGNISAFDTAIYAGSPQGDVTIVSDGNITSTDDKGVFGYAQSSSSGPPTTLRITSTGDINAEEIGIYALHADDGDLVIVSRGNITANTGAGIYAGVDETGNVFITSTGNIISNNDDGIEADVADRPDDSGSITIVSDGTITAARHGIWAQNGDPLATVGGTTTITSTGDVTSTGAGYAGIYVQNGDFAGPSNLVDSTVTITSGSTVTGGSGAGDGVLFVGGRVNRLINRGTIGAASGSAVEGGSGQEQIHNYGVLNGTVNLGNSANIVNNAAGGIITGDLTTGTGNDSFFNDGTFTGTANLGDGDNVVTNTSPTSFNGALITGAGNDTATNSGAFNGTFDLGGGTNVFNNVAGGVLNSGATLSVGAGNPLNNAGTLSPGGSGASQTTALTGNLVQTSGGIFLVDVDPGAGTGDLVTVTGTANLAGTVQAQVVNPGPGTQSVTILTATGGTTNNGLGLLASPALQASLSFPNANDVVLTTSIDFSAGGLNPNQTALAGSLNSALAAGVGGLEPVLDPLLNNVFTIGDYRNALNQLLPEVMLNTETATLFASEEFIENLFSCRLAGDNHTALSEGECYWARPQGRFLDRDSDANTIGFDETSGGLAAGAQVAVAPNWFAGFALGYERASLDTDTGAETDSNRFSGGLSLKYQAGSFLLGAAISGGVSGNDTQRPISFGGVGGFNATAEANYAIKTLTGQARAAYVFQFRDWFAKPLVDVTATYLSRDGVTETGAGAANLTIAGSDETFFSITPALEIGGDFALSETAVIRPYVRAGVSFYTDSDHGLTASFVNAPAGTGAFSITSDFDDVFADVAAGATAFFDNGSSLGLAYEGLISSDTQQHGISVKGTLRF